VRNERLFMQICASVFIVQWSDQGSKLILVQMKERGVDNGVGDRHRIHPRVFRKVHWETTARFFRRLAIGPYRTFGKYTLLVLLCGGLAGVLIDLDHLVIRQTQMVRPFHLPIWIGLCIGAVGYYAYCYRRVHHVGITKE